METTQPNEFISKWIRIRTRKFAVTFLKVVQHWMQSNWKASYMMKVETEREREMKVRWGCGELFMWIEKEGGWCRERESALVFVVKQCLFVVVAHTLSLSAVLFYVGKPLSLPPLSLLWMLFLFKIKKQNERNIWAWRVKL